MKRKDNIFRNVTVGSPPSSTFDLSHDVKMSFRMGYLTPSCLMEAVPGDRFSLNFVNMLRFTPLVSPVMHKVRCRTEYFFIPNRILWPEWESFITGVSVGAAPEAPYILVDTIIDKGTLADYMGIPPGDYTDVPIRVNALPFAAYLKVVDDWYRDQNLVSEVFVELVPGDNSSPYLGLINGPMESRAWEHDYFTSALPTPQQGTEVDLPLTFQDNIPVVFDPTATGNPGEFVDPAGGSLGTGDVVQSSGPVPFSQSTYINTDPAAYDPRGSLVVDVQSDAATINDLREAFSLQAFLERSIRGGMRYIEQIWSHFQVKSSDSRLQRPELIGRAVQTMTISEVLATAQSNNDGETAEIGVGTMAGHGISVGGDQSMRVYCEEHGFIMGLISVTPDTAYQDGLHRMFSHEDRLSYLWPSFANLGEQAILNKEVLCHDLPVDPLWEPDGTWGYIPRYAEYRYMNSRVAGDFRDTLAYWTLARQFSASSFPFLSAPFIQADPRTDIFAVTEGDHILAQVINAHSVNRRLPRQGIPSTL